MPKHLFCFNRTLGCVIFEIKKKKTSGFHGSYCTLSWFLRPDVIFFLQRQRKKNTIIDDPFCCFMNELSWVADTHSAILPAADSCLQKEKNGNARALCFIYRFCACLWCACGPVSWASCLHMGQQEQLRLKQMLEEFLSGAILRWWTQETASVQSRLLSVWLNLVWSKDQMISHNNESTTAERCWSWLLLPPGRNLWQDCCYFSIKVS